MTNAPSSSRTTPTPDQRTTTSLTRVLGALLLAVLLLPACNVPWGESSRRQSCAMNLKNLGQALALYAAEHDGAYPPLQRKAGAEMLVNPGVLMFDWRMMAPDYIDDCNLLLCPSSDQAESVRTRAAWCQGETGKPLAWLVDDTAYTYLGWFGDGLPDSPKASTQVYADGVNWLFAQPEAERLELLDQNLSFTASDGQRHVLKRLGAGLPDRCNVPAVGIPVLMDTFQGISSTGMTAPGMPMDMLMFNHVPGGSNVLYLDGHVAFVKYPSYPVTHEMAAFLGGLRTTKNSAIYGGLGSRVLLER